MAFPKIPLAERLGRNARLAPGGCLLWTGTRYKSGHGRMTMREGSTRRWFERPHRVAWELAHGPIPKGMHLHHKCGKKLCFNLLHLELLTPSEHRQKHLKMCPHCGHVLFGNP